MRKMIAWATAGSVCPASMVRGIRRSGTSRRNLSQAMVGANEPTPSVSKKLHRAARESGADQHQRVEKCRKCERDQKSREHACPFCELVCDHEPVARIIRVEREQLGVAALPRTRFDSLLQHAQSRFEVVERHRAVCVPG